MTQNFQHGMAVCLLLLTMWPSNCFSVATKNNNLFWKTFSKLFVPITELSVCQTQHHHQHHSPNVNHPSLMFSFRCECLVFVVVCIHIQMLHCVLSSDLPPNSISFPFPMTSAVKGWDCCGVSACLHLLCRPSAPVQQAQTGRQMAAPLTSEKRAARTALPSTSVKQQGFYWCCDNISWWMNSPLLNSLNVPINLLSQADMHWNKHLLNEVTCYRYIFFLISSSYNLLK